jgi:hypothetical protein
MIPPSSVTLLALSSATVAAAADVQLHITGFPGFPDGFSPRYYGEAPPKDMLARRQDDGACDSGEHNCLDLGDLGAASCCPETMYCYFKPGNWSIGCCGFGANCDTSCTAAGVRVNVTTTTDYIITPSQSQSSGALQTVLQASTTETVEKCKSRPCAVSMHLCPTSLGGQCCPNEQTCAQGGSCTAAVTTTSAVVSTRGCSGTPNAFSCTVGGGCCLNGQSCAYVDQTSAACAGTADNVTTADGGGGLSQGAKAGIGAGIAVAAALLIAGVTWFCIRRRKQHASGSRGLGPEGTAGGGGGMRDSQYYTAPGARGATLGGGAETLASMSEASGPASQRLHCSGRAMPYHGPVAVPGPFTVRDEEEPTYESRPAPMLDQGGVPAQPDNPADIRMAVEVAGDQQPYEDYPPQQKQTHQLGVAPVRGASTRSATAESAVARGSQQSPGLYELQGSFGDPSPMSQEVAAQSTQPGSPHSPHSPGEGNPGSISPQGGTLQSWPDLDLNYNPNNYHYRS